MNGPGPLDLAERVLAAAAPLDAIVILDLTHELNTRWARNTVTTNGDLSGGSVTLIAVEPTATGARNAALTRPLADLDVGALAADVVALARLADPAPDAAALIGPSGPGADPAAPAGDASLADLDTALAGLGDVFARAEADGLEHFGFLEVRHTTTWLASTTGLRLRHDQPEARLEMTAKSHGRTRSSWRGYGGRSLLGVDIAHLDAQVRRDLLWQARTADLAPGRHPVLLSPSAVADLMIDLYWGADGRSAAEGRSAFSDPAGGTLVGQRLGDRPLRLTSDPAMRGRECAPVVICPTSSDVGSVFDNGLPLAPTEWIADGRLENLVTSRHTAELAGLPVRPWIDNLALDAGGAGSLDDVIARTDTAVLVTCTWYNRMVDPQTHLLTGLTRDGTFVVRGGEVVGALPNYRFNESPVSMLHRIADAGAPASTLGREMGDYFTRTRMPALLIDAFNLSSVSQAV